MVLMINVIEMNVDFLNLCSQLIVNIPFISFPVVKLSHKCKKTFRLISLEIYLLASFPLSNLYLYKEFGCSRYDFNLLFFNVSFLVL